MRIIITYILLSIFPAVLTAQDTHYWGSQNGTAGFFTPGAVIAYNGDSSVLFYNPALLVHANGPRISANANIYYFDKIKLQDGAGAGRPLNSSSSGSVPQLLSGSFRLKGERSINIGYGLMTNTVIDFQASQRRDESFNVLDDSYSPGKEFFVGQLVESNTVKTFSGIAGIGFPLSHTISAGFYVEGTSRRQKFESNYIGRALVNPPGSDKYPLVSTDYDYNVSYSHQYLKLRAGFAWDGSKDHIGLLVQSPSIQAGGKATLVVDEVINNADIALIGLPLSLIANTRQEKLKVKWKDPLSIAAGYSHRFNRMIVYGAVEYFGSVKNYSIISPRNEAFIRPDTGQTNQLTKVLLQLRDTRKAVLNAGLGISYGLSDNKTLYFAFRTDFTYRNDKPADDEDGIIPYTSNWNIWHWQTGVNLKRPKYNMRIGLYFDHGGSRDYMQAINFDNPTEQNLLVGDPKPSRARYFSAGLILSYLHNF